MAGQAARHAGAKIAPVFYDHAYYLVPIGAVIYGDPYITGSLLVKSLGSALHLNLAQLTNLLSSLGLVQLILHQHPVFGGERLKYPLRRIKVYDGKLF